MNAPLDSSFLAFPWCLCVLVVLSSPSVSLRLRGDSSTSRQPLTLIRLTHRLQFCCDTRHDEIHTLQPEACLERAGSSSPGRSGCPPFQILEPRFRLFAAELGIKDPGRPQQAEAFGRLAPGEEVLADCEPGCDPLG